MKDLCIELIVDELFNRFNDSSKVRLIKYNRQTNSLLDNLLDGVTLT